METQSGFALVILSKQTAYAAGSRRQLLPLSGIASLLTAFCLLVLSETFAQTNQSAITLKSGEIVYGRISSVDSIQGLRLENDCGIRFIQQFEIDTIVRIKNQGFFADKKKSWYNISSLALLFGEGRNNMVPIPSLTMVNGYNFHPQLFTGIGIGYEYYEWSVMPVFAELKYFLNRKKTTPFLGLKLGAGISLSRNFQTNDYEANGLSGKTYSGVLVAPEAGLLFPMGKRDAILLSLGYHHQELSHDSYTYYYWIPGFEPMKKRVFINYNRISLRVSYLFH